jgi:hypothetical protein
MFDVPPLPLFEVSFGAKLTDVKRPPTPLFHLFQIASVVVSNALWKWPVRTESEKAMAANGCLHLEGKSPEEDCGKKGSIPAKQAAGQMSAGYPYSRLKVEVLEEARRNLL